METTHLLDQPVPSYHTHGEESEVATQTSARTDIEVLVETSSQTETEAMSQEFRRQEGDRDAVRASEFPMVVLAEQEEEAWVRSVTERTPLQVPITCEPHATNASAEQRETPRPIPPQISTSRGRGAAARGGSTWQPWRNVRGPEDEVIASPKSERRKRRKRRRPKRREFVAEGAAGEEEPDTTKRQERQRPLTEFKSPESAEEQAAETSLFPAPQPPSGVPATAEPHEPTPSMVATSLRAAFQHPPHPHHTGEVEEVLEEHATPPIEAAVEQAETMEAEKGPLHMMAEAEDYEFKLLVAKSALVLSFSYGMEHSNWYWFNQLLQRTTVSFEGFERRLWLPLTRLPKEVADLNPQFRQVVGWSEPSGGDASYGGDSYPKTWTCHRLQLNPVVKEELFSGAKIHTVQSGKEVPYDVDIEMVELLLYPLGSALLIIHVNWLPQRGLSTPRTSLSLPDIRTLLFVAKYRQNIEGVMHGWSFSGPEWAPAEGDSVNPAHVGSVGEDLFLARYRGKAISLSAVGNWLLHFKGEDPNCPPLRLDMSRHATHHSTVVVDKEPPPSILREYLYHLRRAFGQANRPPPVEEPLGKPPNARVSALGVVLVWRVNRYIGISREGIVSMSWPLSPDVQEDFEVRAWAKKFQGLYLILSLHIHAEKLVFLQLSDLAAAQAEHLTILQGSYEAVKQSRNKLRDLTSRMVRYTLSMSSNDCGGISEYNEFFTTVREVLGIPELRDELSGELKDVLALIESSYLEEEKRKRDIEEAIRHEEQIQQRKTKAASDRKARQFEITVSILGALTVPFSLVTGIFGMNLKSLPSDVDFWLILGCTLAFSIVVLVIFLFLRFWQRLD